MPQRKKSFENTDGNGKNVGYHNFLLPLQCFLIYPIPISIFESLLSSTGAFNLDQSKKLQCGKDLKALVIILKGEV